MSDSTIQVPPDSTGKKLDTEELSVGSNTVQRQRVQLAGQLADAIAAVLAESPASDTPALCVRIVGGVPIVTPNLAEVLAEGFDANAQHIENLPQIYEGVGETGAVVDIANKLLVDGGTNVRVDWQNGLLKADAGQTVLNFNSQAGPIDDADALTVVDQLNTLLATLRTYGIIAT